MYGMLTALTYPAVVPHNRAFGVGRGLFARRPLPRGTVLVCPDVPRTRVKATSEEDEDGAAPAHLSKKIRR